VGSVWLDEQFADQGKEYRPASFWALNDKLDETRLEEQIEAFKEAGFGGFFLHARPGLDTECLSLE